MFDIGFEFSPTFLPGEGKNIDELVITSCKIHGLDDNRLWSQFDEEAIHYLNSNDYGFGCVDFEIGFKGYKGSSYPKVFVKCFRLVIDGANLCILPMKYTNEHSYSKINQNGELVISIRYFFRTENEMKSLTDSRRLMIESFFALGKPTNTYAFACQVHKNFGNEWHCEFANTYRRKKRENIKWLID